MRKIIQMGKLVKKWKPLFPKVREKRKISSGKHIGQKYFEKSDQQVMSPKDLTIRKAEIFFDHFNDLDAFLVHHWTNIFGNMTIQNNWN